MEEQVSQLDPSHPPWQLLHPRLSALRLPTVGTPCRQVVVRLHDGPYNVATQLHHTRKGSSRTYRWLSTR